MEAADREPEKLRPYLQEGTAVSLLYAHNAKLSLPGSGTGICLRKGQDKLNWLSSFKDAVRQCVVEERELELPCPPAGDLRTVLRVTGYASVAPEEDTQGDSACASKDGKTFNCKVANLRARAVAAFLTDGTEQQWACPSDGEFFSGARDCPDKHCDGERETLTMRVDMGDDQAERCIGVVVERWASEDQMKMGKPAYDGEEPGKRMYRVEVLNRAVHIEVSRDFCAV